MAATIFFCAAILVIPAASAAADQKLILKDGSDQVVRSYEIQGDRVRFFSAERQEWEEIPESLVDWKATESARREAEKPPDIDPELKRPPAPPRLAVAPGVYLPETEGVYVYDGRNLLALMQSQATIRNDTKRRILGSVAPVPIIKGRAFAELPGGAAKVSVTGANPVLYLRLTQISGQGYGLVRLKVNGDSRIVGSISINPVTGSQSESQDSIPFTMAEAQPPSGITPAVKRLTPKEPFRAGEYALVEYVEKGKLNLFVWDFRYQPERTAQQRP